jgi:hypothetical protein
MRDESSDEDEKYKQASDKEGLTIDDFRKLTFPPSSVVGDFMVFVWVEKEYISDVIDHLESQAINYVENVCFVQLDRDMEQGKCLSYY